MKMDKDDLQVALNEARDCLKTLNDKIGRDQFRDNRKRPHWDNGNKSFDDSDKRPGQRKDQGGGGGGKRPRQNVFSRLEPRNRNQGRNPDYNEVVPRPKISSRVTKEIPRREDVVAAQSDEQSRARNKRIFGSLLMGTLNKFSQDESRLKGRVEKKAIIEKKVEEQELRERETIKQERRNLFIDRKKRLMEVRLLEIKMERMQDLAVFEEAHKQTRQFIRTTAGPKIFFLPKHMNETTTKLLQDSQRQYDEELAKKREDIQQELLAVEERLQRELEMSLEEKPAHAQTGNGDREAPEVDRNASFGDDNDDNHSDDGEAEVDDRMEEEEDQVPRPRLTSQIVKSHVEVVSMKNNQPERHVLQGNKKMIISVVNNTRRF